MKRRQTDKDRRRIIRKGVWKVSLGGKRLRALRADKGFHKLIALMRLANQMRFVNMAALQSDVSELPPDRRQLHQSLFFCCALAYEGWLLAQRLGQHYRHRAAFKDGLGALLRDPRAKAFVDKSLKAVRNQAMFHPGEDEIGRCLAEVVNDTEVVTSGIRKWAGFTYYDLADHLLFPTLVGPCKDAAEFKAKLNEALKDYNDFLTRYLHAADELIVDVLMENKPRFESVPFTPPAEGSSLQRAEMRARKLP